MNLEILSYSEAIDYTPKDKTYAIRIFDSDTRIEPARLKPSENWVDIKRYNFDDVWPRDWKEYSWMDSHDSKCLEISGHPYGRDILFNEKIASDIIMDFWDYRENVSGVVIHCVEGLHRAPAIGKAMNEIFGWGIKEIDEAFPLYRRFVYQKMMDIWNTQNFLK